MKLKTAAVAGLFYPDDQQQLSSLVQQHLSSNPCYGPKPRALIVPHAGIIYSGSIAALAYNRVAPYLESYSRIILLGPSHRLGFDFLAALDADSWRTPMGDITLDRTFTDSLVASNTAVRYFNDGHQQEHCLEVQLPFLQLIARADIAIVPIVVGSAPAKDIQQVIAQLLADEDNLIIISSDLSHFHPYQQAIEIDRNTRAFIEDLQPQIRSAQACGCHPLNGFLANAGALQLHCDFLGYCNSGDSGADKESVVGYGAFAFQELFSSTQKQQMLQVARQSIICGLETQSAVTEPLQQDYLQELQACFVSLHINDSDTEDSERELRGCIGNLQARDSLGECINRNAFLAAFKDPRFAPLSQGELAKIEIEISVLTEPKQLAVASQQELLQLLRPGIDGLMIRHQKQQATFLPSVWEQLPEPQLFVSQLKAKAGFSPDYWPTDMQCFIYRAINFCE
ncbi:MAG: AmmeMemoRadiSam system protein B [Pseudomonadales bacterium]|nr:AmmeMemoRadiSam system protein B [Pseudomonadales bacterium]